MSGATAPLSGYSPHQKHRHKKQLHRNAFHKAKKMSTGKLQDTADKMVVTESQDKEAMTARTVQCFTNLRVLSYH
jgi:hypothetical protein